MFIRRDHGDTEFLDPNHSGPLCPVVLLIIQYDFT